jgi:hypothetical protein
LPKVQAKGVSEQRIKSREKRLHRIIKQMAHADSKQDFEGGALSSTESRLGMNRRDVGLG